MPVNANPDYIKAEKEYLQAETDEAKLEALEKMISFAPKHKGAENLRKDLRRRLKKLKEKLKEKSEKRKSRKKGIKKAELQGVFIGLTNSGKSSLLKALTNANPKIASYGFTTQEPEIGTFQYQNCNIQLVELPPIAHQNYNKEIVHNADTLLIVVEKIHEISPILNSIKNKNSKKIIVFNKIDLYDETTKRKISETLKAKGYNFVLTSALTGEGIEKLKEKIFKSFNIIRVYLRPPGTKEIEDKTPVILPPNSTLEDVAKKVFHDYYKKVKYAKVWGPSSKFPGQKVGLKHVVKDNDIVEFYTS